MVRSNHFMKASPRNDRRRTKALVYEGDELWSTETIESHPDHENIGYQESTCFSIQGFCDSNPRENSTFLPASGVLQSSLVEESSSGLPKCGIFLNLTNVTPCCPRRLANNPDREFYRSLCAQATAHSRCK